LDITAYAAIKRAECKLSVERRDNREYERVYICSPYRGDVDTNIANALRYCRFALEQKRFPIAPHLYLPRFMDDDNPAERSLALSFGIRLLNGCSEIWVFGDRISKGMEGEIEEAKRKKINIRYFNHNCEEKTK
jgi:hypothetical protein